MSKYVNRFRIIGVALITAVSLLLSVTTAQAAGDNPAAVSKLLSQSKWQAHQLRDDAVQMELFALVHPSASSATQISDESYAETTRSVNADVSALQLQVTKLANDRSVAAPWQQMEIDQIKALVNGLASNTEVMVQVVNDKPDQIHSQDFQNHIWTNLEKADQLISVFRNFDSYGNR